MPAYNACHTKLLRKCASRILKVINNQKVTKKDLALLTGSTHEHANQGWNNRDLSTHYSIISSKSTAIQKLMVYVLSNGMAEQTR